MSTRSHLVLPALALALLAGTGLVTALMPEGSPSPSEPSSPVAAAPPTPPSIVRASLEMSPRRDEDPKPPADRAEPPVPTRLGLELLGTMRSDEPGKSLATIHGKATGHTWTVQVGSFVEGAEVVSIERARVVLSTGGHLEFLDVILPETSGPSAPSAAPSASAVVLPEVPSTLRQTGPGTYTIQKRELAAIRARRLQTSHEPPAWMSSHVFDNGTFKGKRMSTPQPDDPLTRLGLESGDLLVRINGLTLEPYHLRDIIPALWNGPRIELELIRDEKPLRLTYTVEE